MNYAWKRLAITDITHDLCLELVKEDMDAINYIPEQFRTEELWRIAITNCGYWLKELPSELMSEEFCLLAVKSYGRAIEYVPEQFKTKELFFAAVRQDSRAFKHVDFSKLTGEEYTEICRIAFEVATKSIDDDEEE